MRYLHSTTGYATISNTFIATNGVLMHAEKLSISLPSPLVQFIKEYQNAHECKSQSEVIKEAIKLLRQKELEEAYREANNEIDPAFDILSGEGLDDETW